MQTNRQLAIEEAIANADAAMNNVCLPNYSELAEMFNRLLDVTLVNDRSSQAAALTIAQAILLREKLNTNQ